MTRPAVYDAFGAPPAGLPPSVPVRRWDEAFLAAAVVFTVTYLGLAVALFRPLPGLEVPGISFGGLLATGLNVRALSEAPAALSVRALVMLTGALVLAAGVFVRALKPQIRLRHVSGPRLLQGRDAETVARRLAAAERGKEGGFMRLHPALDLPKRRWTRHMLIYGSVGSGKTQILLPIVEQAFNKNLKLFCFDVKGDFTACFPTAALLSPWDERSRVWDIGRDLASVSDASTFAQAIIPADEGGSNRYFSLAAQQLLFGAVRSLQNTHGRRWGWADLAKRVNADRECYVQLLQEHYPKAVGLIADGSSTASSSVLATLSAYTRVIDDLAAAWGDVEGRKTVSLRRWVRDDYKGRRQIIVQAGADAALTSAYIGSMVKLLESWIISPAFPDDELGRSLLFVLDELPAIAKNADVSSLIDKGRSRGVCVLAGLQDLSQIRDSIGVNKTIALASMVGTHVVCRVQMGESRDQIAAMFGRERVSLTAQSSGMGAAGSSTTFSVHEETRAVVEPSMLGELGKKEGKRKDWPCGFAIRALVSLGGSDVLELDFPGVALTRKQPSFVPAAWTRSVKARTPTLDDVEQAWSESPTVDREQALLDLAARFASGPRME